ncbi:MAG TPA: glycosyltransferase [Verrucomicrobiae bacterium]|nr:glycosyltransferase [Verrucomicrobiae bacterium]
MSRASIIIPAFNQAGFLAQAIESALQQTHADTEVVVVDDGSTDDTSQVAARFADRRNFKLIRQANTGLPGARNRGLAESAGDYVCFLDSDDYLAPEKIAKQARLLDENPDLGFVYCDIVTIDEAGRPVAEQYSVGKTGRPLSGNIFQSLMLCGYFPPHTVLIRRSILSALGGFDPALGGHADYELWLRVAGAGYRACYQDERLAFYRNYSRSMSKDGQHMLETRVAAFRKIVRLYPDAVAEGLNQLQLANQDLVVANQWLSKSQETLAAKEAELARLRGQLARYERDLAGSRDKSTHQTSSGWQKQKAGAGGSLAVARQADKRTLEKNARDCEAALQLGTRCSQGGDLYRALECFERAVALVPEDVRAHIQLAAVLIQIDRIEDAAIAARDAVGLAPYSVDALRLLAGISFHLRRFEEAVDLYRQISALSPDDIDAVVARAQSALALGHRVLAELLCQEVLEKSPEHPGATACLAKIGSLPADAPAGSAEPGKNAPSMSEETVAAMSRATDTPAPLGSKNGERKRLVIVHKDTVFSPVGIVGGAERAVLGLARAVASVGWDVHVVGRIQGEAGRADGVTYINLGDHYSPEHVLENLPQSADALICVNRADVLKKTLRFDRIRRRILWLHDAGIPDLGADPSTLYCGIDGIAYVSGAQREFYEGCGLPPERGFVVYNGVDLDVFHPGNGSVEGAQVTYSGALVPEKGIRQLIEAFVELRKRGSAAELYVYGSAQLWGMSEAFDTAEIANRYPFIHFMGLVDQAKLCSAYNRSLAAIVSSLPSRRLDPLPLTSVEAQACGCPVIVTRSGGLPESILPGETGFILEGEDPEEWATQLEKILAEITRRPDLRKSCAEHAAARFQWSVNAGEFIARMDRVPGHAASGGDVSTALDLKELVERLRKRCQASLATLDAQPVSPTIRTQDGSESNAPSCAAMLPSEPLDSLTRSLEKCPADRSLEPSLLTVFHRKVRSLPSESAFPANHLVCSTVEDIVALPVHQALAVGEYWIARKQLAKARELLNRLYPRNEMDCRVQDALFRTRWYETHGLPENVGTELQGRYCPLPFERAEIYPGGSVHFCCPAWGRGSISNLFQAGEMDDVWNSETAKDIRKTILDGSYRYCRKISCPVISGVDQNQLQAHRPAGCAREGEEPDGHLSTPPKEWMLSYDRSCNLFCPGCRREKEVASGAEAEQVMRVTKDVVFPLLRTAEHVGLNGSGEALVSPAFRWLLAQLPELGNPALAVTLQTNGQLFTEREWARLSNLRHLRLRVRVSIDASEASTYARLRRGGDFNRLLQNLELMKRLRDEGSIKELRFRYVVQEENVDQMESFVLMAKRYHADQVHFQMFHDWGVSSPQEAARKMVHDPSHPRHQDFLTNLSRALSHRAEIEVLHYFGYLAAAEVQGTQRDGMAGSEPPKANLVLAPGEDAGAAQGGDLRTAFDLKDLNKRHGELRPPDPATPAAESPQPINAGTPGASQRAMTLTQRCGSCGRNRNDSGLICLQPFYFTEFTTNGDVYTCCPAWVKLKIGNIRQRSLEEIWNSGAAQLLRARMYQGDWRGVCNEVCEKLSEHRYEGRIYRFEDLNTLDYLTPQLVAEIRERRVRLESFPTLYNLSNSTVCNLNCIMCGRNEQATDPELVRKTFEGVSKHLDSARRLVLTGNGDPLARPDTREILMHCQGNPDLQIDMLTNGLLLPKYWDKIKHQRFHWFNVSVDAATKATYEKIRRGGSWEVLLQAFEILQANCHRFGTTINMTVMRSNYREIPEFIDMADRYGFHAMFRRVRGCWGTENIFEPPDKNALAELKSIVRSESAKPRDKRILWTDLLEFVSAADEQPEAATVAQGQEQATTPRRGALAGVEAEAIVERRG